MKKIILSIFYTIGCLALVVTFASAYAPESNTMAGDEPKLMDRDLSALPLSGEIRNGIRIINVKAFRYGFDPNPIVVNQGDKVQVDVQSTDVEHGFAIHDYNVDLTVPAGEIRSVVFTADTKGVFDIECSVFCGPGHSHMKAKLVVK